MVTIGNKAPSFTGKDQDGKAWKLADFKGKTLVLYFYPKDDTPGCTVEACSFRDSMAPIRKAGAVVIGISTDDEKSHKKFIAKHQLPFPLLADPEKKIVQAFGVWGEKSFMGRKYMGTNRVTFIIDANGVVRKIFERVTPAGHAQEVLDAIKALGVSA